MSESFKSFPIEELPEDMGFEVQELDEGATEQEAVDFFMRRLSTPEGRYAVPGYRDKERGYYDRLAREYLAGMQDATERERLQKFLEHA